MVNNIEVFSREKHPSLTFLGASISLLGAFYWALSSVKTRLELFGTVYKCDRKTLASRYLWYIRGATGAVRAPWQGKTTITWRRTTTAAAAFYNAKKKSKMVESKKHSFSKSPVLKIFLWKFYWLVLGLIGLVDAKGIDVPQPTEGSCLMLLLGPGTKSH